MRRTLTLLKSFWGMAALSAAEYNFPDPPPGQPQWVALAQAVFNTQAARWDMSSCNGGLRWQIFQWNNGFDYKNSISQACFFNLAARLALYTRNGTYADWANRVWDWMIDSRFMTEDAFYIYDGAHVEDNCTALTPYQWTYNAGAFLLGAAAMYNYTADGDPDKNQLWHNRTDGLLHATHVFFIGENSSIMAEVACESVHLCDLDQQSFKAYLARWMAATTKWAPWTYDYAKPLLDASAIAAAQQCMGGDNGRMCGLQWATNSGKWDGTTGIGQQMAAMEVVLATMIHNASAPMTGSTGGTSIGNPDAGTTAGSADGLSLPESMRPITKADVAGACIMTIMAMVFLAAGIWFVCQDDTNDRTCRERWQDFRDDLSPRGTLRYRKGRHGEEHTVQRSTTSARLNLFMDLDGTSTLPAGARLPEALTAPSVSVYSDQGDRSSMAISRVEHYPDRQPWRRRPREGDYAGAIDPKRGDGAGFGILDDAGSQLGEDPSSPLSGTGRLAFKGGSQDSWAFNAGSSRELTTKTMLKLQKKPLPGKPGLGRRFQGPDMGDMKV